MWGIKSQVFGCSNSILRLLFNLRWSWRSWSPDINDLQRSKYEINENTSGEVLNHMFFGVPIPFWDTFLTSDDHRGRDLLQLRGRSKYGINENKSNEVSNHRFFGVPIPFWDGGKDQNKWIYKKINMISWKISHDYFRSGWER